MLATLFLLFLVVSPMTAQRKCATDEYLESLKKLNPGLEQEIERKMELFRDRSQLLPKQNGRAPIIIIPVVFNVVHTGEVEGTGKNLSTAKLTEQITILNDVYSNKHGSSVDFEIQFCIAQKDVFGNLKPGVNRYLSSESHFIPFGADEELTLDDAALKSYRDPGFPSNKYLNIWTADIRFHPDSPNADSNFLGYASFPFVSPDNPIDGVVVDYQYLGVNSGVGSTGMTAVHEIGHWMGLYHNFHDTEPGCVENFCGIEGDEVCDTEPRDSPAESVNYGVTNPDDLVDHCDFLPKCSDPSTNTNAVKNYMDYNHDSCYSFFTEGQKTRVRQMLLDFRTDLANNTVAITECSTTDPGGGTDPDSRCTANDVGDALGYRIRETGGGYGSDVSIDKDLLVVGDDTRENIFIYRVDECDVSRRAVRGKFGLEEYLGGVDVEFYGGRVIAHEGKVFVSGRKDNDGYVVIYEENEDEDWEIVQFIQNDSYYFGGNVIAYDDELLITSWQTLFYYKRIGGTYVLQGSRLMLNSFGDRFIPGEQYVSYNGTYLAIKAVSVTLASLTNTYIFKKNEFGHWPSSPIDYISDDPRYSRVTLDAQNRLYLSDPDPDGISRLKHYVIDFRDDSVDFIKSINLQSFGEGTINNYYWQQPLRIHRVNNTFISVSNGAGVSFYNVDMQNNRSTNDLERIIVPELAGGFSENFLNPYYDTSITDYYDKVSEYYGYSSDVDGNYLVVANRSCQEVYVYSIGNLLNDAYPEGGTNTISNLLVSQINSNDDGIITANNITFEESMSPRAAAPIFNTGDRDYVATNSIVIKEGTEISGRSFTGRISSDAHLYGDDSCSLSGGTYRINEPSSSPPFVFTSQPSDKEQSRPVEKDYGIKLYPNPTKSRAEIYSDISMTHWELFSQTGVQLKSGHTNAEDSRKAFINLDNWASGVYFIRIYMSNGDVVSKTLIKQ